MTRELKLVKNIYFDTSTLIRLPLAAPSPDFLNLKDSCDILKIKLLIPELVLKEYINYNQRKVQISLSQIGDSLKIINDRISLQISFPFPEQSRLFIETEELMKKKIADLGIVTFKKDISPTKLEELALKEISYRERSKKKSLRDTLILLSIIEHASESPEYLSILIADDKFFQTEETKLMIESCKANIKIVKSLSEARDIIDETITDVAKWWRKKREETLKLFLESQNSKIIEFVRKGRFNSFMLAIGEPGELPLGSTIKKINAIDYESIDTVRPPEYNTQGEAQKVKISFTVRIKFTVVVRFYPFPPGDQLQLAHPDEESIDIPEQFLTTRTTTATYIDSPPITAVSSGNILSYLGQNMREQTISRNIIVEASATLKSNKERREEYSDLVLERLIT